MTTDDEPKGANGPSEDAPGEPELAPDEGDPSLATFVRLANAAGVSMGVTLWVGGSIVSGVLVGVGEYLVGMAEALDRSSGTGDAATSLAALYRRQAASFREEIGDDFEAAFEAPYTVTFIHLRDARVFSPSGDSIPRGGFWWRGRIDRVDGFFIGSLAIG